MPQTTVRTGPEIQRFLLANGESTIGQIRAAYQAAIKKAKDRADNPKRIKQSGGSYPTMAKRIWSAQRRGLVEQAGEVASQFTGGVSMRGLEVIKPAFANLWRLTPLGAGSTAAWDLLSETR